MLSESEKQRLTEIELLLQSDDPTFLQRFEEHRQPWLLRSWRGLATAVAVVIALSVAAMATVVGSVAAAVVALSAAGAFSGTWLTYRRRR
jgi:predicted ATP-grasp superfamily ATP-dependent carboligase